MKTFYPYLKMQSLLLVIQAREYTKHPYLVYPQLILEVDSIKEARLKQLKI